MFTQSRQHVLKVYYDLKYFKKPLVMNFVLGAVYQPHDGSIHYHDDICDNIAKCIFAMNCVYHLPIFMIGDFNSKTGTMQDYFH